MQSHTNNAFLNSLPKVCVALALLCLSTAAGCSGGVYVRNGVTSGDTFFVPADAVSSPDPVVQSWIGYSVGRSQCQLRSKDENPARTTSFECEMQGRRVLVDMWMKQQLAKPGSADDYLDTLDRISAEGFMQEYVWHYLRERSWSRPVDLDLETFSAWRQRHLPKHKVQTRWIGSWGYKQG